MSNNVDLEKVWYTAPAQQVAQAANVQVVMQQQAAQQVAAPGQMAPAQMMPAQAMPGQPMAVAPTQMVAQPAPAA